MKRVIVLLVLVVGMISASGQGCLPEGLYINCQEQIDNFPVNYPGCTEIEGNVNIYCGWDITNFNGLSGLTTIGGGLYFTENFGSFNLTGLEGLTTIGGTLLFVENNASINLTGLEGLTTIGGGLNINENYGSINLTGLEGLTSIGGNLYICDNDSLIDFTGLGGLATIDGFVQIWNNNSLVSLAGLEGLTSIGGFLSIRDNPITTLSGLEGLTSIGGSLEISITSITNLIGLEGITSIEGGLYINDNLYLTSLTGLDNLESGSITNLTITNNPNLTVCNIECVCNNLSAPNGILQIYNNGTGCNNPGAIAITCGFQMPCLPVNYYFTSQDDIDNFQTYYPGCTELQGTVRIDDYITGNITNLNGLSVLSSITGILYIENNDELVSLAGLEGLISITGSLIIQNNDELVSLAGLEGLTSIGDLLRISYNNNLISFTGLEGLTSIEGEVLIDFNNSLMSFTGLEEVTFMGGNVYIQQNPNLTSLTGLEGLSSIGGSIYISFNDALVSLTGLEGLTSIEGNLGVQGNNALPTLTGLENIQANSIHDLYIINNSILADCDIYSICQYLASPNGTIYISNNDPGCNSQEEVEEHCLTGFDEQRIENGIIIIPNPANDKITISSSALTGDTQLSIFNVSGEKLIEKQLTDNETQIDISALPQGVYFVRLQNEKMVEVGKMVKE
jgi:hypothetical protein